MADLSGYRGFLQKRVAAEARVLLEAIAGCDVANAMPDKTAQVAHLLLERRRRRIRIVLGIEQQGMSALRADVFVTAVAIGELLVVMLAEKTRQRVTNARDRSILGQVFGSAPAPPVVAARLLEHVVVDVMAPEETRQFG